jgi:hypothetical protein
MSSSQIDWVRCDHVGVNVDRSAQGSLLWVRSIVFPGSTGRSEVLR